MTDAKQDYSIEWLKNKTFFQALLMENFYRSLYRFHRYQAHGESARLIEGAITHMLADRLENGFIGTKTSLHKTELFPNTENNTYEFMVRCRARDAVILGEIGEDYPSMPGYKKPLELVLDYVISIYNLKTSKKGGTTSRHLNCVSVVRESAWKTALQNGLDIQLSVYDSLHPTNQSESGIWWERSNVGKEESNSSLPNSGNQETFPYMSDFFKGELKYVLSQPFDAELYEYIKEQDSSVVDKSPVVIDRKIPPRQE